MKYPFGLTHKPNRHYFSAGMIKFSMKEGIMHFEIKQITKQLNATIFRGIVKDKTHLEQLSSLKSLNDVIRLLTEVINQ